MAFIVIGDPRNQSPRNFYRFSPSNLLISESHRTVSSERLYSVNPFEGCPVVDLVAAKTKLWRSTETLQLSSLFSKSARGHDLHVLSAPHEQVNHHNINIYLRSE